MKQLIDIGDPNAPQGSEPWCRSFHQSLCRLKREGEFAVSNLKYSLREFREHDYFKQLVDDKGRNFESWEQFVECREPYGLGMKLDVAVAIIDEPDDTRLVKDLLGEHAGAPPGNKNAAKNNVGDTKIVSGRRSSPSSGGSTARYILARLERDGRNDLADKVRAGELSANAAAIMMEYRKAFTPFAHVFKQLPKLSDDQLDMVIAECISLRQKDAA